MKFFISFLFLVSVLFAEEDFLSDIEYAKKLYHDPKGISCAQCHGEKGEGSVLSAYVIQLDGKKKLKDIEAPRINNIKMFDFLKAFEKKINYMPTYYLTDKELAYIYFYITKFGKVSDENVTDTNTTNVVKEDAHETKVADKNITTIAKDINNTKDSNETIKK